MISDGNSSPPWETKYAGPLSGTGRIGVVAVAWPTTEAAGQPAGSAANCAAAQAFCNVFNCDGSCLGSSTLTLAMFASLPSEALGKVSFAVRLAPRARLVLPDVETLKPGLKARLEQSAAW